MYAVRLCYYWPTWKSYDDSCSQVASFCVTSMQRSVAAAGAIITVHHRLATGGSHVPLHWFPFVAKEKNLILSKYILAIL